MTLPAGITTCTVTIGKALGSLGEDASLSGTLTLDRRLVWSATGDTLYGVPSTVTPSQSGGWLSFIVAHVDQAGFVDQSGNSITGFSYTFSGRATFTDGSVEPIVKHFQVFVGQSTLDLDLLPDGPATLPVVTPTPPVDNAAVAGFVTNAGATKDALSSAYAPKAATYASGVAYVVGQLVVSGTTLYRVTTAHTSSGAIDLSKFATAGGGVPTGGTTGQTLVKNSGTDGDATWAPVPSATFNTQLGAYNVKSTNYRRTRAACARARNGVGGIKVGIYGHSVVNNTGASTTAKGWPARLRALMQASFGDAGDGLVALSSGGGYGPNEIGNYQNLAGVSKTAVTDRFRFWGAIDGNGGTVTPTIDASAQTTINLNGSSAWSPVDYALTQGSHTITFATTGFPTQGGLEIRRNGGIGAQVWSFGVNGQQISSMATASQPTSPLASYAVVGSPDLVVIECMGNDFKASTSISAYATSLAAIVNAIKTAGVDVLIVGDYQFSPAEQTGIPIANDLYVAAIKSVCDTYDIGMADLTYKWGSYAIASAAPVSYMADQFHPNDAGHQDIASSVFQVVQSLGVGA